MPAGTSAYIPLANITLGSTATTVTFSSISQSYADLIFVLTNAGSGYRYRVRFNSDTGTNYNAIYMEGNGSTAGSQTDTSLAWIPLENYNTFTNMKSFICQVMDYSAADKHKNMLVRGNGDTGTVAGIGRWANTSAITSIQFFPNTGSFAAGSTFALYGVSA